MSMYNPPHPGEFIKEVYLDPFHFSYRNVAGKLKVSPSTFQRLIKRKSSITPEMALRLSKTLGRSPESWLAMQDNYNLWQARQTVNLEEVEPLTIPGIKRIGEQVVAHWPGRQHFWENWTISFAFPAVELRSNALDGLRSRSAYQVSCKRNHETI